MRKLILCLLISSSLPGQTVNAILGDTSWFQAHHTWPQADSPEQERLSCHLTYVLQKLSSNTYQGDYPLARAQNLQHLRDYIEAGVFPQDFQHPDKRRPCFIDDAGRLCAVGYLIAKTAGLAEAERINQKFRFHYLLDMQDSSLLAWQSSSGLSLKELAMIQPAYGWERAAPFYLYQHRRSLKYGLKRTKNNRVVIRAKYDLLRYDPSLPFLFGLKNGSWHIFNQEADRINRKDYDTVGFVRHIGGFRLIAADGQSLEAYNAQGELLWKVGNDLQMKDIFRQDQIRVTGAEGMGVVNARGQFIIPAIYDSVVGVNNLDYRLAAWRVLSSSNEHPEKKWGLLDTTGKEIIEAQYDQIEYRRGVYILRKGRDQEIIDSDGKSVVGWGLKSVSDGLCRYCLIIETEKGFGHYNGAAKAWDHQGLFMEMQVMDQEYYRIRTAEGYGIMNVIGQAIIAPEFEDVRVQNRFIFLKKNDQWGLRSYRGEPLIDLAYDTLGVLAEDQNGRNPAVLFFGRKAGVFKIFAPNGQDLSDQYQWEDFEKISTNLLQLKKGQRKVLSQYHQGQLIYHQFISIDYARPLGASRMAYGQNGKEGIWTTGYGLLVEPHLFRAAQFDTIASAETQYHDKFLVQKDGKWGIYSYKGDSLEIPCEHDAFFPKDRASHSGWIYFRKDGLWQGYFYTVPRLHSVMPRTQAKLDEWWAEEN